MFNKIIRIIIIIKINIEVNIIIIILIIITNLILLIENIWKWLINCIFYNSLSIRYLLYLFMNFFNVFSDFTYAGTWEIHRWVPLHMVNRLYIYIYIYIYNIYIYIYIGEMEGYSLS